MGNIKRNRVLNSPRNQVKASRMSNNSIKRELKALSGKPKPAGVSSTKKYASKKLRNMVAKRQMNIANSQ